MLSPKKTTVGCVLLERLGRADGGCRDGKNGWDAGVARTDLVESEGRASQGAVKTSCLWD